MKVGKLTLEQKETIENEKFSTDSFFNPIEDDDGNWVISIEEIDACDNDSITWIKDLPLIDYKPRIVNPEDLDIPVDDI